MPIAVNCDCGRALRIKDELAGKKIRCPECKALLAVPAKESAAEDLALEVLAADDDEELAGRSSRRPPVQAEPPKPPPRRPTLENADPRITKRPKPRRESERRVPRVAFEPGWFGSMNSGVIGGILMILIAVVWFVCGLMGGYIFFYPPILAVIGLVAIVKGCFSS